MAIIPNVKVKRWVHSPFTVEHEDGTRASCDKDGKITLTKDVDDDEVDEIQIPASLIFKLANMLESTRKLKFVDKE